MPGHPVVHPREDMQDLQALAMLVQDGAQGLHKPGPASRVPPRVIAWDCRIGEEKVGFNRDLVSGIGICIVDGPRVSLDPVIELCPPASLSDKAEIAPRSRE